MLERSLGSKAWDDSPMQMIQIPEIGKVAVRKLVNAGIRSIEDLEATDARRIETIVGKNPPFGLRILDALNAYPKLRVSLHVQQSSVSALRMQTMLWLTTAQDHKDLGWCQSSS